MAHTSPQATQVPHVGATDGAWVLALQATDKARQRILGSGTDRPNRTRRFCVRCRIRFVGFESCRNTTVGGTTTRIDTYHALPTFPI